MGRKKRSGRKSKWNFDLTAGKLVLINLKRWKILEGAGDMMQGNYTVGLNKMGEGTLTGVITDSVTSAIGYRVKTILAPKGVPLLKTAGGKIGL